MSRIPTNIAFKEWATVIRALETGQQTLLLRKGGISEGGQFQIQHRAFLFYPTYEHQYVDLLQPQYHDLMRQTNAAAPPIDTTRITGYAEIAEIFHLKDMASALALKDQYVWNEEYVRTRFNFKPDWPLYGIVLRAYRLPEPVEMPFRKAYGGCRSWIELEREIPVADAVPALSDEAFADRLNSIRSPLTESGELRRFRCNPRPKGRIPGREGL
ncbi:MAG: DUF1802 family protein [Armatimonadetes bacterium]|nr:DUF1802 family protein [Armatimonadota bacterium]